MKNKYDVSVTRIVPYSKEHRHYFKLHCENALKTKFVINLMTYADGLCIDKTHNCFQINIDQNDRFEIKKVKEHMINHPVMKYIKSIQNDIIEKPFFMLTNYARICIENGSFNHISDELNISFDVSSHAFSRMTSNANYNKYIIACFKVNNHNGWYQDSDLPLHSYPMINDFNKAIEFNFEELSMNVIKTNFIKKYINTLREHNLFNYDFSIEKEDYDSILYLYQSHKSLKEIENI